MPEITRNSLMVSVRVYFDKLYPDEGFRKYLISVGNKDAVTGNRMFDRSMAVKQIIDAAKIDQNAEVMNALPGDIYLCMVRLMGTARRESKNDEYHITSPHTSGRGGQD